MICKKLAGIILVVCIGWANCVLAQGPGQPGNTGSISLIPPPDAPPVKATPPGPYKVTVEANPLLLTHTIYRPENLSAFIGANRLPIIAWGNGACSTAGSRSQQFLTSV